MKKKLISLFLVAIIILSSIPGVGINNAGSSVCAFSVAHDSKEQNSKQKKLKVPKPEDKTLRGSVIRLVKGMGMALVLAPFQIIINPILGVIIGASAMVYGEYKGVMMMLIALNDIFS